MRRFDIPAAPSVAGGRGELLRLVDPRGRAVAWLDPRTGRCVGYAVRPAGVAVGGWREVLGGAGEGDDDREAPPVGAIAVGWPWPGEAVPRSPVRWRLIERDPTAATYACHCASTADPERAVVLTLGAWFDDGMLRLRLVARAAGMTRALGPQFRLTLPRSGVTVGRFAASDATEVGLVLRRADTVLRFAAHQEPTRPLSWSTEIEASGVIYAVSATPLGAIGGDDAIAVLTVTVGPAE